MPEDPLFRWIALAIVLVTFSISSIYRRRADREGGAVDRAAVEAPGIRRALIGGGLLLLAALLAYLIHPPLMAWSMVPVPETIRWAGVVLGVLTAVNTGWIFRSLGLNVTPTVVTRQRAALVTHGPYRFIRHPLYVNGALAFLAVSLMSRSWLFAVMMVPTLILLSIRTRDEEVHLASRFGDAWTTYASRTGRFLPRLRRS